MPELIDDLIDRDRATHKRLLVLGDAMEDVWVSGEWGTCADGCPLFREVSRVSLPGGAANAARQLRHWNADAYLAAPLRWDCLNRWSDEGEGSFRYDLCFGSKWMPVKTRYTVDGRIVHRHDAPEENPPDWQEERDLAQKALRAMRWDGVYVADYGKGFFNRELINAVIRFCKTHGIPCVSDGKLEPACYADSILKCNEDYRRRYSPLVANDNLGALVVTRGSHSPVVRNTILAESPVLAERPPAPCVNHVGAGDCFGVHLLLALTHGFSLEEASAIAHAAGRVFVQRPLAAPPRPFEVRRDLLGVAGKVVSPDDAEGLRRACAGKRLVFTNGVFRVPHAGHAWLCEWARQQGGVLVVGMNDDESARLARQGAYTLPFAERAQVVAGWSAVDWVVPFGEDEPIELMRRLKPDVLVKGHEYEGKEVPGMGIAGKTVFAPEGPFRGRHVTSLLEDIRR